MCCDYAKQLIAQEWQFFTLVIIDGFSMVNTKKGPDTKVITIFLTAFGGGPKNPYLLHNHDKDQVVYAGTHDNDTVMKFGAASFVVLWIVLQHCDFSLLQTN